jgi:hypothetical protein
MNHLASRVCVAGRFRNTDSTPYPTVSRDRRRRLARFFDANVPLRRPHDARLPAADAQLFVGQSKLRATAALSVGFDPPPPPLRWYPATPISANREQYGTDRWPLPVRCCSIAWVRVCSRVKGEVTCLRISGGQYVRKCLDRLLYCCS